jgi:hypothetical protein
MKNPAEREEEQRYQKAEDQYISERKDVPVPEEVRLGSDERRQRAVKGRSSGIRQHDGTESPKPEPKEIFSEAVSQFRPIDAETKSPRVGDSKVERIDQVSPGVEDARGANRVRSRRDRKL